MEKIHFCIDWDSEGTNLKKLSKDKESSISDLENILDVSSPFPLHIFVNVWINDLFSELLVFVGSLVFL